MHLCYDVCFHTPAEAMAESGNGVSDFVYGAHWENEEGPPVTVAIATYEAWSRGTGANLLAADAGMGLMHTGSGIFSEGRTLASAWRPDLPHNEVLLVATVPRIPKARLNYAGGAKPQVPWGTRPLSRHPPHWELLNVSSGQPNVSHTVEAPEFQCAFSFSTLGDPGQSQEVYALVALNGSFFGGGLPARACMMFRVPPSNIPNASSGGVDAWVPWFNGSNLSQPLYRQNANTALEDLGGSVRFGALHMRGDFQDGDIVRPLLAGGHGTAFGNITLVSDDGRGMKASGIGESITQAMLFVNTHPPHQIFE